MFESKVGLQFYANSYHYFTDTIPQNVYTAPYNSFSEGSGWSSDWRWTNKVSYDFTIHRIHKISAFVAYESQKMVYRNSGASTPNLPFTFSSFQYLSNGAPSDTTGGVFNSVNGSGEIISHISEFGNINYSLLDRYLFSFIYRHDGASVFGPDKKYGDFVSYSAGWRISAEKFFQVKWIDDLKLRAAIGENGNDAIPYVYSNLYSTDPYFNSYDLNGTNTSAFTGVGLYQIGSPSVHWETNKTTNLGVDFSLLKNRLSGSFSWFNRKTKGLFASVQIPGLEGDALAPYENVMSFSNKGIELELAYNNHIGKVNFQMNF